MAPALHQLPRLRGHRLLLRQPKRRSPGLARLVRIPAVTAVRRSNPERCTQIHCPVSTRFASDGAGTDPRRDRPACSERVQTDDAPKPLRPALELPQPLAESMSRFIAAISSSPVTPRP